MTKATRVLSTPPTNTPISQADATSRRRFLSQAAGIAAGGTVLALAAIPPASAATALTGLADPSDERLVAAAEGLFASQAAIDQLYREHDYALGYGEVDERADCQALLAVQDQHVETLVTLPAASNAGLRAKASVVAAKFMADGFRPDHKRLAVSLANDLVGGAPAVIPATPALAAPTGVLDPVFALIAAHREAVAIVRAIEAEATRESDLGIYVETEANDITEPASAELGLFVELTEAVPTTLAGVVALVTYLDEINKQDPWKFEDNYATPLIGALATAFNRMAVPS